MNSRSGEEDSAAASNAELQMLADERALLRSCRVSVLVTKNSGGTATAAKLEAARICGVEVVMIDRPAPQNGLKTVQDAAQAKAWLLAHAGTERGL